MGKITVNEEEYLQLKAELEKTKALMKNTLIWQNAPAKVRHTFTQQQIQKILDTIQNSTKLYKKDAWGAFMRARDRTIVMTIYFCALRPLECCALKFGDINLEAREVLINGENNKTKNGRVVPIPETLLVYLKEYLQQSPYFWKGSEFLFPNFGASNHLSSQCWKSRFRNVLKEAGIWQPCENSTIPPYSSYSLRHTRASELLEKSDMDIYSVSNILGHKKLDSTQSYLHKNEKYMQHLKELMDKK